MKGEINEGGISGEISDSGIEKEAITHCIDNQLTNLEARSRSISADMTRINEKLLSPKSLDKKEETKLGSCGWLKETSFKLSSIEHILIELGSKVSRLFVEVEAKKVSNKVGE